jgi:SAM-dependent methyltransferase
VKFAPRARVAAYNRRAWNDVSDAWNERSEQRSALRDIRRRVGGTLWPEERAMLGPVRGRTLLHLQCGAGEDTLSWARLGARVTGVDLAERRIEAARARAARLGVRATFLAADVVRLPVRARSFDIVYTSRGALVWIPDLARWAREIARVLKPGGRFLLCDEHPFLYCLVQHGRRAPQVGWDYFDQRVRLWRGWWFMKGGGPKSPKAETDWKLSDTLNALAGAGLVLRRSRELPAPSAMSYWLPARRRGILPQTLMLLFGKPRRA